MKTSRQFLVCLLTILLLGGLGNPSAAIATVNTKGKVTAKKAGTAVITAKVGAEKLTCRITVENPKINKTKISLNVGGSYQLKISGTRRTVRWSTSKKAVASVTSKGKINAKKAGTAIVTARIGNRRYSCKVIVTKKTASPGITFKASKTSVDMDKSASVKVTYSGKGNLYFSVDDASVISCKWGTKWKEKTITLYIEGKKPGTACITLSNDANKKTIKITVNVDDTRR